LIGQGEILGNVYTQAKDELKRAHIKKIDFYLVQGQLTLARKAYNDAKASGVSDNDLLEYDTRIKDLFKANQ
jgi:hypothetical protein